MPAPSTHTTARTSRFKHYDRDNSGSLEFEEFRVAVRKDAKITATNSSRTARAPAVLLAPPPPCLPF